jgi:endothelin-converting enzyme
LYAETVVCGDWATHHGKPVGSNSIEVLTALALENKDRARQILEGPYPSGPEPGWITVNLSGKQVEADKENFAKLVKTYQSCMNYTALEAQGLEPLVELVKTVVDLFPASAERKNTSHGSHDYSAAMGKTITLFESLGIATTQRFVQMQNPVSPEEIQLAIIPPSMSDIPTNNEAIAKYIELAATLISRVHPANITVKQAARLMESMLEWRATIHEALVVASREETTVSDVLLAKIQKDAPQLNYDYVVGQLAPDGFKAETVRISPPQFYHNYSQIISHTPADVIQTFFVWKAISSLSPYIESQPTNAYNNFLTKLNGMDIESPTPRWQSCLELINDGVSWIQGDETAKGSVGPTGLTWILSRFFLNKYYSAEAKNVTSEIVDNLEDTFRERIETRDWVSSEVKKASVKKLRAIASKIALPTDPDVFDPILLREYYSDVNITSSHAGNALSLAVVNVAKKWATLGKPTNEAEFKFSTLTVNAYYNSPLNEIVLLAGIQQFPVFDVGFPSYILYGGMGSIVGHEITHGFDNKGRLYDATGNKTTWWDNSTIKAFETKTECFIKQYNNFTVLAPNGTQVAMDGELTLGENIADAGGVATSFAAWKRLEKAKGKAMNLPGLDVFTPEQLFFVKWGQSWCKNKTPADEVYQLSKDSHSPNAARIKLTLDNSVEFKRAFNCPKIEPVCEFW